MATIEKDVFITDCSDLEVESASADSDDPSTNNNNEILGDDASGKPVKKARYMMYVCTVKPK